MSRHILVSFKAVLEAFENIAYVERFPSLAGVMQSIDPRVKLCSVAAFIAVAVSTSRLTPLILLLAVAIALSILSKLPLKLFLLRATIFIPMFAGVIALPLPFITPGKILASIQIGDFPLNITYDGAYKMILFTLRVWVCVAFLTLLILTTGFTTILHAMKSLKLPSLLVTMTSITYRFIFIFLNEGYRMLLARESRTTGRLKRLEAMKSLGRIVGTLFIRAYERGERVYFAMVSRGYTGEVRSMVKLELQLGDLIFISFVVVICAGAFLLAYSGEVWV